MVGLPSELVEGDPLGALRPFIGDNGTLQFIQGEGTDALSASLHSVDLSGFNPGDAPLDTSVIQTVVDINDFVLEEQKFNKSNPYAMAIGPNGNQFFADAGANAIIRRDTDTGQLSIFAEFQDLSNPTNVGPPMMDAVPTDIIFKDGKFLVSSLSGFPFPEGQARIYEVDMQGNVSVLKEGFTALIDLAVDPRDGNMLALQITRFNKQSGFQPQTGKLLELQNGTIDTVMSDLNFSAGMHVGTENYAVFVSSLADGEILRIGIVAVLGKRITIKPVSCIDR